MSSFKLSILFHDVRCVLRVELLLVRWFDIRIVPLLFIMYNIYFIVVQQQLVLSEFFVANKSILCTLVLYITEIELNSSREMNSNFKDLASDLGGDIVTYIKRYMS